MACVIPVGRVSVAPIVSAAILPSALTASPAIQMIAGWKKDPVISPFATRLARVALSTALIASTPVVVHAKCHVDIVEMPVKIVGSRAVATVGINGTSVPLTVDSGAFFSMLTDAAAAQLQLPVRRNDRLRVEGLAGRVDARMTTVGKLTLLKGEFTNVQFVVGGNEPGAGTMGLMGRNILAVTDIEYDLANGVIRFLYPNDECKNTNMAYWADGTPVNEFELVDDFRSQVPSIRARVKLNGKELTALFDTGASSLVLAGAAKRVGIAEADMRPAGIALGAGRGRARAWKARFDKFEVGGETITQAVLGVVDFDMDDADMLLGIDYFLSHRIYISKSRLRMFVTYNGGPVFSLDRSAADAKSEATDAAADTLGADELARRAAASAARHDFAAALADLDRAAALAPTSADYLAQRAGVHEALRQPAKAIEDLDQALTIDPSSNDARMHRAALRLAAKNADGAKADLDALDQALPPQSQLRLAMGRFYLALDQLKPALAQFDQWLAAHPNEVTRDAALNSRCWVRLRLGVDLGKALDDCDDAIDADPKNPSYRDSRGWLLLRMNRLPKALADFDRGIEIRPKNAWTLYGRGITEARLGDAVRAEADFAAARALVPDIELRVAKSGIAPEATTTKP